MNYFIIGDIHGCNHTFKKLLTHWNPEEEHLISVGDLVDRGNTPVPVIRKFQELMNQYDHVTVLKGNHEAICSDYLKTQERVSWLTYGGDLTLKDFDENEVDTETMIAWMDALPLQFETKHLFVSHAGLSDTMAPNDEKNRDGLLWNRKALKNIGKVQVHGHTPLKSDTPLYTKSSNSWNIDTGACYGYALTGLRLNQDGSLIEHISIPVNPDDIGNYHNPNDQ